MIVDIEQDPRHGLQVQRYHTWPTIRKQSVGEHSAQIVRIMLTIWPECPRHLLVHGIMHDIGEMVGDLPYPIKKNDPVLKERMNHAERRQQILMSTNWGCPRPFTLTEFEENFFKLCESIEMWEFGIQERNMGNRYATIVATRMLLQASTRLGRIEKYDPTNVGFRPVCAWIVAATKKYIELRKDQEDEIQYIKKEDTNNG